MGLLGYARALRAGTLACVLAWFGSAADLRAETLSSPLVLASIEKSAEPFGLFTAVLSGIAAEDLRIVIMHDTLYGEDHAVAAARLDGRWLTLDNRRMAMVEDAYVRNYRPLYVIDHYGVMQYVEAPVLAAAPGWERSAALKLAAEAGLISSSN